MFALPEFSSLSELMNVKRKPNSLVALEHGKPIEWTTFLKHVAGLCQALQKERQGPWLVSSQSSYAFAVGLLAIWHTDNIAILPPNHQPGTLKEMGSEFCGIVSDSPLLCPSTPVLSPLAFSAPPRKWKRLENGKTCLKLFTSGSSGDRKEVPKTLLNFETEIATQEATFGPGLGACAVLSTVSHQHIYGLLCRLLWPLCAGRPFVSETPLLWEELLTARKGLSKFCIVSSPAHLAYACAAGREKAPSGCRGIFSSGALLKKQSAKVIRDQWGLSVIEIFGSTETGGVGWRMQNDGRDGEVWKPLNGVDVSTIPSEENRIRVISPFTTPFDREGGCPMGDRGTVLPDGRFLIDGRVDRIVKIGGKRLSLDDMESRLKRHPWVRQAALTVFAPGVAGRQYVGAIVVLSDQGQSQLEERGHRAVDQKFKTELKKHFDAVVLPHRFSYVDSLPMNSQGKTSREALNRLVSGAAFPEVKCRSQKR